MPKAKKIHAAVHQPKNHKHVFRFSYTTGKPLQVGFRCLFCSETTSRRATVEEHKFLKTRQWPRENLFKVWRSFCKLRKESDDSVGHAFNERVARWAQKQPKGFVHEVRVDDSSFMSSSIWLIENKTHDCYMGINAVYVPQDGDTCEFFMYPGHFMALESTLKQLRKAAVPIIKRQRAAELRFSKVTSKWRP